jgi:hypothetical protein
MFLCCTIELDPWSFANAQKNVASNGLGDRIRVVKVDSGHDDEGRETGLVFGFDRLFEAVPGASLGTERGNDEQECVSFPSVYVHLTKPFQPPNNRIHDVQPSFLQRTGGGRGCEGWMG